MPTDFFEKTLEDIIFENQAIIHNYGLPKFRKTIFRQFVLPSGKKLDIFSYDLSDGHIIIDIYELKRYAINAEAICQAYNYFIEVTGFTAGKFKSVDIHIIMIGRSYDPVLMFEKMELPFSVYTYDYKLTGMTFRKHQERKQMRAPHENFCLGLWAFGTGLISFTKRQPEVVNIASVYANWRNVNHQEHGLIVKQAGSIFEEPTIKEVIVVKYEKPKGIRTEIFPPQPQWTAEFACDMPPDEHMFDLEFVDEDYELEPIEADLSDFEPEIEGEDLTRPVTLTHEEWCKEFAEGIINLDSEEDKQTA